MGQVMPHGRQPRAFHPLLLAAYPALFLYSRNMEEATPGDLVRALAVLLPAACLLWLAARLAVKDRLKAALIVSLLVVATFSFGYVIEPVRGAMIGDYLVGRALVLEPIWCLILGILVVLITRTRRSLVSATVFANTASVVLVGAALLQAVVFHLGADRADASRWRSYVAGKLAADPPLKPPAGVRAPNIYYIILDEYTRADVLKNDLGFDNSEFVSELERRGFYVAERSVSNYTSTYLSLSSSLNLDYLQALREAAEIEEMSPQIQGEMIHENRVVGMLKQAGYSLAVFPSDYRVTDRHPHADRVYRRRCFNLSEFERVLFDKSLFAPFLKGVANHRRDVLYNLDNLGRPKDLDGPVFVFAHIMVPHPPYVFDSEGKLPPQEPFGREIKSTEKAIRRYTGQIAYTNKRILEAVDRILKDEEEPPVIILQGDHGFRRLPPDHPAQQRVVSSILNAYYLPPTAGELPGPSISPVNSFRLVFNGYLGGRFGYLPDESYYSPPGGKTGVFLRIEH